MRDDVQSVAEFMRHPGTAEPGVVTAFYTDVIGLPVLRAYPVITMLWAGEDLALELKYDTDPADAEDPHRDSPAQASYVPVFRSHDLARTRQRLARGGYPTVEGPRGEHGETCFVVGPDRLVTGFTHRDSASPLAADTEALRRWEAGPRRLPGVAPMAPELHYMSRILMRSPDPARTSAHLARAFGLDVVAREGDSAIHALGDTVVLEVAPGGVARTPPADRNECSGALLMRVHDLDALAHDAAAAGACSVGEPLDFADYGIRINYYAEPGGAVLGFLQRGFAGDGVEDEEAARRWARRRPSA